MERKDKILIGRLGLLELATASLPLVFTGTEKSGNFGKLRLNPRLTKREGSRWEGWHVVKNMWFFHHAFGRVRFQVSASPLHLPPNPNALRKLPRRWPSYRTHCSAVLEAPAKGRDFLTRWHVGGDRSPGFLWNFGDAGKTYTAWKTTFIAVISGILK